MTEPRTWTPTEEQQAKRRLLCWGLVPGYAGMGAALMSGFAFGVWQGSAMAGLWMASVLIGVPLSLGAWGLIALVINQRLTAPHTKRDD
jgi:hypothetical protein